MKANEFLHNGEKVTYYVMQDESWFDLLDYKGIVPEELPVKDMRYRVLQYNDGGKNVYACIFTPNAPDAYIEEVYITSKIPEDSFNDLMLDVFGQLNGKPPKQRRSRLSIACENADRETKKWIEKQYPDQAVYWMLKGYPEEIQKEYNEEYKLQMQLMGYSLDMLEKIKAVDIDMNYMKEFLK